ncbi:MAG TPA: vanadium-dependent haloperoxidase, partial [Candidatus Acidoferrum sp.]|nr:vanadium-dependent haloperoxidase [Candidatus Acidoferrum sp.]
FAQGVLMRAPNHSHTEVVCSEKAEPVEVLRGSSRRAFLGQAGTAAAIAVGALTSPGIANAANSGGSTSNSSSSVSAQNRVNKATQLRVSETMHDQNFGYAVNVNNGDDALYADKAGTFTKGLAHDAYGRVTAASYASLKKALTTGAFSDFESIILGGTRTLNGPQGGLAYDLEALDGTQFGQPQVPPAPKLANDQTGTELLEHYWGALLRDVAFTDYDGNALATAAAAELSSQASYVGPRNGSGQVTPDLLFRGIFPGETLGPYLSQFFVQPTSFGAQPLGQQMNSFLPNLDFGTNFNEWLNIQNGVPTGLQTTNDPTLRYRRNGRDLAAFTRVDVLYQAYFVAFLVLAGIGAPLNPGNPYVHSTVQNGFGSFGGPDFAGMFGEVATKALNVVWWQKWFVHLRPRPEATGGIVQLVKTGQGQFTDVTLSKTILDSNGLQQSFNKYGSWLLPLAFPEGSPVHPAYPTGHGTVGGACLTVLKFIFDGSFVIANPVVPTSDGLSLQPYTGADAGQLTVNGELNKLGHNVSFGHGIHAGIHWRSDTDTSLRLGEAVALSFLQNRARTYNEPFTINITKFDGSVATISNE